MKSSLATPILMIIVLFVLAAPAFGQIAKDGELNPFFGISTYSKKEFKIGAPQVSPPIDAKFELADALRWGVRFNVANHGHWGEEFYYSYENNRARFVRQTFPLNIADLPINVHNFGITGLFYFTDNEHAKTRPFVNFGLGATMYRPTQEARTIAADPAIGNLPGFGQANEVSMHYGVGFKQRITNSFGLRLDVSHFMGRNPSFSLSRHSSDPKEPVWPAEGMIHNFEATGGLIFYFGR